MTSMAHPAIGGSSTLDVNDLAARARAVRAATVRMAHTGRTSHVASALSCVDILVTLYFHSMRIAPDVPDDPASDRFILSKGHGCMAWFATLAERGYFPGALLQEYSLNGGRLAEHPSPGSVPGVDVATGSLGHGLSIAAGRSLVRRIDGRPGRTFVILSDGECNEGSIWEAAMFSARWELDNLVAIIDYNKWQAMGRSNEVTALAPLADKWRAFGWETVEVDGHDLAGLATALDKVPISAGKPTAIVAHTVKGKGVSFMEGDLEWHYRPPGESDLARALLEIKGA